MGGMMWNVKPQNDGLLTLAIVLATWTGSYDRDVKDDPRSWASESW